MHFNGWFNVFSYGDVQRRVIKDNKYEQWEIMHGGTLTTQQHVNTIAKPQIAPAVPTTHVNRINNITPNIFWIHGKKHPISVPEINIIK